MGVDQWRRFLLGAASPSVLAALAHVIHSEALITASNFRTCGLVSRAACLRILAKSNKPT